MMREAVDDARIITVETEGGLAGDVRAPAAQNFLCPVYKLVHANAYGTSYC
jgi:hypothetical protein